MAILLKPIYSFNVILIEIPMTFFAEIEKKSPQIHIETQKTPISQTNLKEIRAKLELSLYMTLNHTTDSSKQKQYGTSTKQTNGVDHWNRIEDHPGRSPHSYRHFIFDKNAKNILWTSGARKTRCPHVGHETRFLSLTLYKNQLKIDQRP
jgi:hypothetical protein